MNYQIENVPTIVVLGVNVQEMHQRAIQEPEMLEELKCQADTLSEEFTKWVYKAKSEQMEIDSHVNDCLDNIRVAPSLSENHQFAIVSLAHQISIYHIYLRRVVKAYIHHISEAAQQRPEMQHLIGLIKDSEKYLIKQLPVNPFTAKMKYDFIDYKLKNMTEKMISKARPMPQPCLVARPGSGVGRRPYF